MKLLNILNIKKVKIVLFIICLFLIIIFGINIFLNQISFYGKNMIKKGELNAISNLLNIDKNKYDLIISYLSENDNVKNYYYGINVELRINENTIKYLTIDEYNKELTQYKDYEIENITYNIWYYKRLMNKYLLHLGDPTGKCFTLKFRNNEFIGKYLWK